MAFCEPVLEHQHELEIVSNHRLIVPVQYQPGFEDIKSLRISGVPFVIPRPQ